MSVLQKASAVLVVFLLGAFASAVLVSLVVILFGHVDMQHPLQAAVVCVAFMTATVLGVKHERDRHLLEKALAAEELRESAVMRTRASDTPDAREKRAEAAEGRIREVRLGNLFAWLRHGSQPWNQERAAMQDALIQLTTCFCVLISCAAVLLCVHYGLKAWTAVSPPVAAMDGTAITSILSVLHAQWVAGAAQDRRGMEDPVLRQHGRVLQVKVQDDIKVANFFVQVGIFLGTMRM